jgi:hypothetical protein
MMGFKVKINLENEWKMVAESEVLVWDIPGVTAQNNDKPVSIAGFGTEISTLNLSDMKQLTTQRSVLWETPR